MKLYLKLRNFSRETGYIFLPFFSVVCFLYYVFQLEAPAQKERFRYRDDLYKKIENVRANITYKLKNNRKDVLDEFDGYQSILKEYHEIKDEILWEMISSMAFVFSVSSTTG